jgi:hypothetical protein
MRAFQPEPGVGYRDIDPSWSWSLSMISNAEQMLEKGSALLIPLMVKQGFSFEILGKGGSSGGHFAYGEFRRVDRKLELHFRHSLGIVTYHLTTQSMSHQDYMRSVISKPKTSHYPGFSEDPLDGFRHLLLDLQEHCSDFLSGTDECLQNRIELANHFTPVKSGLPD